MELTQKILKELIEYDPETGIFTWKERGKKWFDDNHRCKIWNSKFSKRDAGSLKNHGYIIICVFNKRYLAQHLAWLYVHGEWPKDQMDHKNHIRNDNRIDNLRLANYKINSCNRSFYKNNTSGFNGIYWNKSLNKWMVFIIKNKKRIYLGLYKSKNQAIQTRKAANIKYEFHENHGVTI